MNLKSFFKNPRILLWLALIIISVIIISPNLNPRGQVVLSTEGKVNGLVPGDIIYSVDGKTVSAESFQNEYFSIIQLETSKGTKYVNPNGTLGIEAEQVAGSNIKFGLDIKGGVRAIIQPNDTSVQIEEVVNKLRSRINVYGLRETVLRPVYRDGKGFIEVSIAGGTREELQGLIESQGKFEADIPLLLLVRDGKSTITLKTSHTIDVTNTSITVEGNEYLQGESFNIDGIDFVFHGVPSRLNLTAKVFSGDDIKAVLSDPQRSRLEAVQGGLRWSFGLQLSSEAAQKFAWVTQNTNVVQGGQLDSPIILYLDDKLVDRLSIDASLKGKAATEISISGVSPTKEEAALASKKLQSILRSGALPTSVSIAEIESLSPTLGAGFLQNAMIAGLAAIIGIITIVSLRYRKPKLVLPMVVISLSEILIVMAISVRIGWTIDLPSIAGLIASVGTGIDSQIIILDRALRRQDDKLETLRQKLKNAFFVVFGAAGTVIAAMLPLLFLDILRGFAIVTILGVLVGVLVARPAYGVIVERMKGESQ